MTVLVTGGLGYLGSLTLQCIPTHPAFADEEIRILDNFRQPRFNTIWSLPGFADYEFYVGDIRNPEVVERAMDGVDIVFHLAAITNASETFEIEEETWDVNYNGALRVFQSAIDHGVDMFVNASTCSVYGKTDETIEEGFDCSPESPYGEAKLQAEQEMLSQSEGEIGLTALRLGTVYGWTPGMRFDTVVDKFALQAATGQPLTVYEGAAEQMRPYLHVRDAIRSILFAGSELGGGEVYNVVGQNAPLKSVVDAIKAHFEHVEVAYVETEHLDQLSYIVSDEKLSSRGFTTQFSLDSGVRELADMFRAVIQ